jgi:predicted TIM-barrel fold metal-dependent hydrolase
MIVDGHVHFGGIDLYDKMMADMARGGFDRFCIQVSPRVTRESGFTLADAVWFKHRHPDRVYVFGGLDYSGMSGGTGRPEMPLLDQLERLRAVGCDGLKMLSGKPTVRRDLGWALDDAVFEPLLSRLEETGFPVLWHVGDPPEFWNPDAVPLWAKRHRWWYDETCPPKEQIDREIANVFSRHPKLNLILPHFFFLSQDLPAAAALLEAHPSYHLDLAPGVEMYHTFTANYAAAREFFLRWADRILLGTDIGLGNHGNGPLRGWMVRHWLETDDVFDVPDDPFMTPDDRPGIRGIHLPAEALEKIESANFHRIVGADRPRALDRDAAVALLEALARDAGLKDSAARALAEIGPS